MSELRTCSAPFLRPIFARVASILLLSCGSDWPELGSGSPAPSRAQHKTPATNVPPKRTEVGQPTTSPAKVLQTGVQDGFKKAQIPPCNSASHHGTPHLVRTRHRSSDPDARHHLPARRGL